QNRIRDTSAGRDAGRLFGIAQNRAVGDERRAVHASMTAQVDVANSGRVPDDRFALDDPARADDFGNIFADRLGIGVQEILAGTAAGDGGGHLDIDLGEDGNFAPAVFDS